MKKQIIFIIIVLFILLLISCGPPKQPPLEKQRIKFYDWQCDDSQFTNRASHVGLLFGGYYYIIGGTSDNINGLNDVWREVSYNRWVTVTASAEFSGRWDHTGIVFNQKMWIIGGTPDGVNGLNDVWWSEDGVNWVAATTSTSFSPRWGHTSVVFNDKIWVIGGTPDGVNGLNDVWWSEDGVNWVAATTSASFSPRWGHTSTINVEDSYDLNDKIWRKPKIWVIGGTGDGVNGLNDVWYTEDGTTWRVATANATFGPRWGHQGKIFQDCIGVHLVVLGGRDKNNYLDDVWSSDNGRDWIRQNNTYFPKNAEFSLNVGGPLLVLGGYDGSNYFNIECFSGIIIEYYVP